MKKRPCMQEKRNKDRYMGGKTQDDIKQIASLCIPHPSGGAHRACRDAQASSQFQENGSLSLCGFRACVLSNMVQLLYVNCLGLESETGCVHECV